MIWPPPCACSLSHIRGSPVEYEPFMIHLDLDEKTGAKDFCQAVVNVLVQEAGEWRNIFLDCTRHLKQRQRRSPDHVQETTISEALKGNVEIAYFDEHNKDSNVAFVKFNQGIDENEARLTLICWPAPSSTLLPRSASSFKYP